ncbi:MAG TPA: hypothetical protein VF705_12810 [Longimicrobium sp.]|jgi:hypothetical protein
MSGELLQGAAVGAIVLGAFASIAMRGWRMVAAARAKPEDGSCGGCGCGKS